MNLSGVAPEACTNVTFAAAVTSANSGRASAAGLAAWPASAIGTHSNAKGISARNRVTVCPSLRDPRTGRQQLAVGFRQRCAGLLGPRRVVCRLVIGALLDRNLGHRPVRRAVVGFHVEGLLQR